MIAMLSTDFAPFLLHAMIMCRPKAIRYRPVGAIGIAGRAWLNYGGFMHSLKAFSRLALIPIVLSSVLVTGCSMAQADFPSLARRDIEIRTERNSSEGDSEGEQAAAIDRAGLQSDPALAAQLAAIETGARKTHAEFEAKRPGVRQLAESAKGNAAGSERWSVAQTAISDLDASRRELAVVLGDIDSLYVARLLQEADGTAVQGGADQLKASHDRIMLWFAAEQREIDDLQAMLAKP